MDRTDLKQCPDCGGWVCPKCGCHWPQEQKPIKCVTCESIYCPGCKDQPTVHAFECHQFRKQ